MKPSLSDELELTEADLYESGLIDGGAAGGAHRHHGATPLDASEEPTTEGPASDSDDEDVFGSRAAMDIGPHSGSAKSTTLNVVMEEQEVLLEVGQAVQSRGPTMWSAAPIRGRPPHAAGAGGYMAQSMPVGGGGVKMGSSVPIAIRMGAPTPFSNGGASRPLEASTAMPSTWRDVPPHELSHRDEITLAMMGESPGGAMKRDRLRVRNAILKSTGFLEHGAALPQGGTAVSALEAGGLGLGMGSAASLVPPPGPSASMAASLPHPISIMQRGGMGGLSQAFRSPVGSPLMRGGL